MMREGALSMLVIDGESHVGELLMGLLDPKPRSKRPGAVIELISGVREGLHGFERSHPDFVVVDAGQPELDDSQVQERVRDLSQSVPLLILGNENDGAHRLNLFGEKYLGMPVNRNELVPAMQRAHRRWHPRATELGNVFDDANLHLDFTRELVSFDGRTIGLIPFEYRLLATLVRHRGQVLGSDHVVTLAGDGPVGRDSDGKEVFVRDRRLGVSDRNPKGRLHWRLVKLDLLHLLDQLLGKGWTDKQSPIEIVRGFGWRYTGGANTAAALMGE